MTIDYRTFDRHRDPWDCLVMKTADKKISKLQAAITAARKAGFSYADPEMVKLQAEMAKLTGPLEG